MKVAPFSRTSVSFPVGTSPVVAIVAVWTILVLVGQVVVAERGNSFSSGWGVDDEITDGGNVLRQGVTGMLELPSASAGGASSSSSSTSDIRMATPDATVRAKQDRKDDKKKKDKDDKKKDKDDKKKKDKKKKEEGKKKEKDNTRVARVAIRRPVKGASWEMMAPQPTAGAGSETTLPVSRTRSVDPPGTYQANKDDKDDKKKKDKDKDDKKKHDKKKKDEGKEEKDGLESNWRKTRVASYATRSAKGRKISLSQDNIMDLPDSASMDANPSDWANQAKKDDEKKKDKDKKKDDKKKDDKKKHDKKKKEEGKKKEKDASYSQKGRAPLSRTTKGTLAHFSNKSAFFTDLLDMDVNGTYLVEELNGDCFMPISASA